MAFIDACLARAAPHMECVDRAGDSAPPAQLCVRLRALLSALSSYVAAHHAVGLRWNDSGIDNSAYASAGARSTAAASAAVRAVPCDVVPQSMAVSDVTVAAVDDAQPKGRMMALPVSVLPPHVLQQLGKQPRPVAAPAPPKAPCVDLKGKSWIIENHVCLRRIAAMPLAPWWCSCLTLTLRLLSRGLQALLSEAGCCWNARRATAR